VQIDWFTFGAQLINFVVLLALLKRFLYGPIVAAMDRREQRIAAQLEAAKAKQETAQEEAEKYLAMQDAIEAERKERLEQAQADADAKRQELIRAARQEVQQLEREWRDSLRRDQQAFMHDLAQRALHETIAVARRALDDLAGVDLERQAVSAFIDQLQSLEASEQEALAAALKSTGTATLRTAFANADAYRDTIQSALASQFHVSPDLTVATDDTIGFGIELRVADRSVGWSLDSYLTQLTDSVRDRLEAEFRNRPEETPAPTFSPNE
jgi:F-type H+-transporting ATPase subunit b